MDDLALSAETAGRLAGFFSTLADPTRLRLLAALAEGERPVGDLAEALGMSLSAVSHQLATLRHNRLVRARREGRHILYALDDEHVLLMLRYAVEHMQHS